MWTLSLATRCSSARSLRGAPFVTTSSSAGNGPRAVTASSVSSGESKISKRLRALKPFGGGASAKADDTDERLSVSKLGSCKSCLTASEFSCALLKLSFFSPRIFGRTSVSARVSCRVVTLNRSSCARWGHLLICSKEKSGLLVANDGIFGRAAHALHIALISLSLVLSGRIPKLH